MLLGVVDGLVWARPIASVVDQVERRISTDCSTMRTGPGNGQESYARHRTFTVLAAHHRIEYGCGVSPPRCALPLSGLSGKRQLICETGGVYEFEGNRS